MPRMPTGNRITRAVLALGLAASGVLGQEPVRIEAERIRGFDASQGHQGVAVDERLLFAVGTTRIGRYDKATGRPLGEWSRNRSEGGSSIHLDSGVVHDGRLYAAHSNYPDWPMTSSVEVWTVDPFEHVHSHSFGEQLGSFTWLDRWDGAWWGAFANYDRVQPGSSRPYGHTDRTQVVRMNDDFQIEERWVLPRGLLARMRPMSNSGGSWGPDGYLYLTGHDLAEIYVLALPDFGSDLVWIATVVAPDIEGQGIAWDRSEDSRVLWGIHRSTARVNKMRLPEIKTSRRRP